jgi:hypothetical protein
MEQHVLKPACGSGKFALADIKALIASHLGADKVPVDLAVHCDTTNFPAIDTRDVMLLGGVPYFVRGHEREGRFGLDDEPKLWVKRAVNLRTGETQIVKLSFFESFSLRYGTTSVRCVRSPRKEARILSLVDGDSRFMQGRAVEDSAGNTVRVLDYIRGPTLATRVEEIPEDHETYFHTEFPKLFDAYLGLVEAIGFLHGKGENHGDIRRDHVLLDLQSGLWKWIDFDYAYHHPVNPRGYDLFGLGNILIFLAGKGDVTADDLKGFSPRPPAGPGDMNILFRNRVADVGKIYPYIPFELRRVFRHFCADAELFYEDIDDYLSALAGAGEALHRTAGRGP